MDSEWRKEWLLQCQVALCFEKQGRDFIPRFGSDTCMARKVAIDESSWRPSLAFRLFGATSHRRRQKQGLRYCRLFAKNQAIRGSTSSNDEEESSHSEVDRCLQTRNR